MKYRGRGLIPVFDSIYIIGGTLVLKKRNI